MSPSAELRGPYPSPEAILVQLNPQLLQCSLGKSGNAKKKLPLKDLTIATL